jgi:hypothetical protein
MWDLDVSQPGGPAQPVTGIALPLVEIIQGPGPEF